METYVTTHSGADFIYKIACFDAVHKRSLLSGVLIHKVLNRNLCI
jgi:hypothetical protein